MTTSSFAAAVKEFVSEHAELRNSHLTLIVALEHVAESLDESVSASLVSEYRQILKSLEKAARGPDDSDDGDDLLEPSR